MNAFGIARVRQSYKKTGASLRIVCFSMRPNKTVHKSTQSDVKGVV